MTQYTLLDEFELRGYWWLPEAPNARVPATVSFSPQSGISIETIGGFSNLASAATGVLGRYPILLGETTTGNRVTLVDTVNTGFSGGILSETHSESLKSSYLIIGAHFQEESDIEFTYVDIGASHLEEWLCLGPFSMTQHHDTDSEELVSFTYSSRDTSNFQADNDSFSIECKLLALSSIDAHRKVTITNQALLSLQLKQKQTLSSYNELANDILYLLTLFTHEPNYLSRFIGNIGRQKTPYGKERDINVDVFFKQPGLTPNGTSLHPSDMFIPGAIVSSDFSTVTTKWIQLVSQHREIFDLFFICFYSRALPDIFRYLSQTQALESYHRRKFNGNIIAPELFNTALNSIIEAIPKDLPKRSRKTIKSRLKYCNEITLRERIELLLKELSPEISELICGNTNDFVETIVSSRNYYTHYDESLSENALKGVELYYANQRLQMLFASLLCSELGISKEKIFDRLKNGTLYRLRGNKDRFYQNNSKSTKESPSS